MSRRLRRSVAKLFLSENSNRSRELRVGVHRYTPASVNAAEVLDGARMRSAVIVELAQPPTC